MDLRLIALDLDGTTLNSQGKVSPYTKEILEKAIQKGIHVVIASGRALSAIPEDVLNIRGLEYIITSNGSSIFELSDSRRIYANDMKPGVVMSVLAIMRDTHFPFEVFIGGHAYTMQAYYDCPTDFGVPERMNHYVRTTRTPVSDMPDFILKHCDDIEGIDMIVPDQTQKQQVIAALSQDLESLHHIVRKLLHRNGLRLCQQSLCPAGSGCTIPYYPGTGYGLWRQ